MVLSGQKSKWPPVNMIICDYWESYFSFLIVDKILEPGFRDLIPLNDRSIGELQTYISGGSNTQMYK